MRPPFLPALAVALFAVAYPTANAEPPSPPTELADVAGAPVTLADAWAAYRSGDLLAARDKFAAVPTSQDALFGQLLLSGTVEDAPGYLELANSFLDLEPVPAHLLSAFRNSLFPTAVAKRDRRTASRLYERALADDRLPEALRTAIGVHYAIYLAYADEPREGREFAETLGMVTDWSYAGTFPNVQGSGFDVDHAPLEHPEPEATFTNEFGAEVTWHEALHVVPGGYLPLNQYVQPSDAVTYLQTFVTVPRAGSYRLGLGYGGSVKLWVDDALAYAEPEELTCSPDHLALDVELAAGTHRILVQNGAAERDQVGIALRILTPDGQLAPGVTTSAQALPYTPAADLAVAVSYEPSREALGAAAAAPDASLADHIALAKYLMYEGHYREARAAVNELVAIAPLAPYVVELRLALLEVEGDDTGREELLADLRAARPDDPRMISEDISEAYDEQDYDEAERLVAQLAAIRGESQEVRIARMWLAFSREDVAGGTRELEGARKAFPTSERLLWIEYNLQRDAYNQPAIAQRIAESHLREYRSNSVAAELASKLRADGDQKDAREIYEDLLEFAPYETSYREGLVGTYVDERKDVRALEVLEGLIAQAPDVSWLHAERASILLRLDRDRDAERAYARALELDPNNFDVRGKLREVRGERPAFELLDSVDAAVVIRELGGKYAGLDEPFALLSDEVRRVIYEDGVSETRTLYVYEVLNERGVDRLKEYNLGGATIYEAYAVKPDGRHVDGERSGSVIVFPKLSPGDFLVFSFGGRERSYGKLRGHVVADYQLNGSFPVGRTRYQLVAPAGHPIQHAVTGVDLEPTRRSEGGRDYYTWAVENPAVIEDEPYLPPAADVAQVLHISTLPDWGFVVDWYAELSSKRTESDYAVERKIAELFPGGHADLSEAERVRRIYTFITKDIAYSSLPFRQSSHVPQRPGKTLATELGDCKDVSSLFVAMAAEVGVGADLVLVDTRDNGERAMPLPSTRFNHCIARLRSTGQFVELTNQYLPFGTLGNELSGSLALVIDEARGEVAQIPPSEHGNGIATTTELAIADDELRVRRRLGYYGQLAAGMRGGYFEESRDVQADRIRQGVSASVGKSFELEDFALTELGSLSDTVGLTYEVVAQGAVSRLQDLRVIQLPWADRYDDLSFVSDPERVHDLALWRMTDCDAKRERIRLTLGSPDALPELPADVELAVDGIAYALKFSRDGSDLVAERSFELTRDTFSPGEYPAIRALFLAIGEADDQLIALK